MGRRVQAVRGMDTPLVADADGARVWPVTISIAPGETDTLHIEEIETGKGGRFSYSTKYMLRKKK